MQPCASSVLEEGRLKGFRGGFPAMLIHVPSSDVTATLYTWPSVQAAEPEGKAGEALLQRACSWRRGRLGCQS